MSAVAEACDLVEAELIRDVHVDFGEFEEQLNRRLRTALSREARLDDRIRAAAWLRTVAAIAIDLDPGGA